MSPNRPVPRPNVTPGRVPWRGDDDPRAVAIGETRAGCMQFPRELAMRERRHDEVTGNTQY